MTKLSYPPPRLTMNAELLQWAEYSKALALELSFKGESVLSAEGTAVITTSEVSNSVGAAGRWRRSKPEALHFFRTTA